jgi:hypothetical protein
MQEEMARRTGGVDHYKDPAAPSQERDLWDRVVAFTSLPGEEIYKPGCMGPVQDCSSLRIKSYVLPAFRFLGASAQGRGE